MGMRAGLFSDFNLILLVCVAEGMGNLHDGSCPRVVVICMMFQMVYALHGIKSKTEQ